MACMRSRWRVVFDNQPAQDLAIQTAQRRCGEDAFGRAARPHHGVNARAADGGRDAGRQVAIGDQANARARSPVCRR